MFKDRTQTAMTFGNISQRCGGEIDVALNFRILSFGQDAAGELYVLSDAGDLLRIAAVPEPSAMGALIIGAIAFARRRRR